MMNHYSLIISVFFYCYTAHRDLHSFPTRRSSDLTSWRPVKLRIQAFTSAFQEELARTLAAGMNLARHEVSIKRVREYLRSEEHTSELQSLTNLVCRLLLEKKKKINNKINKVHNKN